MKVRIKNPIYKSDLIIIQDKSIQKVIDTYNIDWDANGFDGVSFRYPKKNGYLQYVIILTDPVNINIIAHEALHIVNYMFQDFGIVYDVDNDEPAAYLLGWIVNEITKCVNIDKNGR